MRSKAQQVASKRNWTKLRLLDARSTFSLLNEYTNKEREICISILALISKLLKDWDNESQGIINPFCHEDYGR